MLRHRHLVAYVLGTVEFASADADEAALVSVPPYHIAGVGSLLANLYAGRRIVYLTEFDPARWLDIVARGEGHPRDGGPDDAGPHRRRARRSRRRERPRRCARSPMAGRRMPATVLSGRSAVAATRLRQRLRPDRDELDRSRCSAPRTTASARPATTRRAARGWRRRAARCPAIEVEVREGRRPAAGRAQAGEMWVRGEQVSRRVRRDRPVLDADGWFPTRDRGAIDEEGYLFIEGRADDTIIRGGENIAPAEIEDVLISASRHQGRRCGRRAGRGVGRTDRRGGQSRTTAPRWRQTRSAPSSGPGSAARAPRTTSSSGARCPTRPRESCCDGRSSRPCLSPQLFQASERI